MKVRTLLFFAKIACAFAIATAAYADSSIYYQTIPNYRLDLGGKTGQMQPGLGIDLSDPDNPILAPRKRFSSVSTSEKSIVLRGDQVNTASRYIEDLDQYTEAKTLNTYFKASFGLNGVEGAMSLLNNENKSKKTVYAIIESAGWSDSVEPNSLIWRNELDSTESISNSTERLKQFIADYGSHYIQNVIYGYRISVRGTMTTQDNNERRDFSAAFKAAFGAFGASGGGNAQVAKTLSKSNVQIVAEVTSGGISEDRPIVLRSLAEINDFLSKIKDGSITIKAAPISVNLKSYWHTLDPQRHAKLRADLYENVGVSVPSPYYGVPRGTVISWRPSIKDIDPSTHKLMIPEGWAIFHELTNRFARGVEDYRMVGGFSDKSTHLHMASVPTSSVTPKSGSRDHFDKNGFGQAARSDHGHTQFQTLEAEHLPPYFNLIYLIKL